MADPAAAALQHSRFVATLSPLKVCASPPHSPCPLAISHAAGVPDPPPFPRDIALSHTVASATCSAPLALIPRLFLHPPPSLHWCRFFPHSFPSASQVDLLLVALYAAGALARANPAVRAHIAASHPVLVERIAAVLAHAAAEASLPPAASSAATAESPRQQPRPPASAAPTCPRPLSASRARPSSAAALTSPRGPSDRAGVSGTGKTDAGTADGPSVFVRLERTAAAALALLVDGCTPLQELAGPLCMGAIATLLARTGPLTPPVRITETSVPPCPHPASADGSTTSSGDDATSDASGSDGWPDAPPECDDGRPRHHRHSSRPCHAAAQALGAADESASGTPTPMRAHGIARMERRIAALSARRSVLQALIAEHLQSVSFSCKSATCPLGLQGSTSSFACFSLIPADQRESLGLPINNRLLGCAACFTALHFVVLSLPPPLFHHRCPLPPPGAAPRSARLRPRAWSAHAPVTHATAPPPCLEVPPPPPCSASGAAFGTGDAAPNAQQSTAETPPHPPPPSGVHPNSTEGGEKRTGLQRLPATPHPGRPARARPQSAIFVRSG